MSSDIENDDRAPAPGESRARDVVTGRRTGGRTRHNLVALGTVAVLAVYTAGYLRTREAAQKFAVEDAAPRRTPPPIPDPVEPDAVPVQGSRADSSSAAERSAAPMQEQTAAAPTAPSAPAARASLVAKDVADSPATAAAAPAADSTPPRPPADTAAPSAPSADSAARTGTADSVAKAAAQALADSIAKAGKERPVWHDGEYYGWGTSRHGDIQAGVEIKGGKITGAWIQQCLTRYSCSWIAALPPQVVSRQSPEVDYVSGATQSTNAFYYAVVEALARAK
jgi:uncharacterized protein with FMN-binding domain